MSVDAAMRELLHSPAFPEHLARLQHVADNEEQRRESFYRQAADGRRVEFIAGRALVHEPASRAHERVVFFVANLLAEYAEAHGLGEVFSEACLVRGQRNDYAPDVCFFEASKAAHLASGQRVFPPPDLIVEVLSPATEMIDRTLKFSDYARHGVGEYWVIDPAACTVEQFVLPWNGEAYVSRGRLAKGWRLESAALTGFTVTVAALFDLADYQRARRLLAPGHPCEVASSSAA